MSKPTTDYTTAVINPEAHFHPEPWQEENAPDWKMRYSLALAMEVKDAKVGDVVMAHVFLTANARGLMDCRKPETDARGRPIIVDGKPVLKTPVGCQLTMHCRVATAMPAETVMDLPPKETKPLGERMGGVAASGEDMDTGGTFKDLSKPYKPVKVGRPYYQPLRTWSFVVQNIPCWLLVWVAPKSAGCNGDSKVALPATSDYACLSYVRFTD